MSIRNLLAFACLLVLSVGVSEASERDEFRRQIAEAQWDQATSYAYKHRSDSREVVAKRWLEMKAADDNWQARFALLDFYWRNRLDHYNASREAASMRLDYLQLANQLKLAEADLAFTEITDQYFDRFAYDDVKSFSRSQRRRGLDELLNALKARPDDIAVIMSLAMIIGICDHQDKLDLNSMAVACTSPTSQVVLAELAVDRGTLWTMEAQRPIVESALPHLPNDEIRTAMLRKHLSNNDNVPAIKYADELIMRYPKTSETRDTFDRKLYAVAGTDVTEALQLLNDSADTLGLTPEQLRSMKLTIVNAVGSNDPAVPKARQEDIAAAKGILRSLRTETDSRFRELMLARAILLADRIHDEPWLTDMANYWLEHAPPIDQHEITPVIGWHFMKRCEWEKAKHAWELWPASCGACGCWTIFPAELRTVRIATCLLHQSKYEEAIRVIADSFTNAESTKQVILPFLLFQIYERAGQIDDFEKILSMLESDERLVGLCTNTWNGEDQQRIEPLNLPKYQWTVRGIFIVRSLAKEQNWKQLVEICQSYRGGDQQFTTTYYQLEYPLEHLIAIEATRLLAEAGAESVRAIRRAYQVHIANPRVGKDVKFVELHHEWIYRSLLNNKSPEVAELLQDLKLFARRLGARYFDPDQLPPEKLSDASITWPAPPVGSLPKALTLNWPQTNVPTE